MVGAAASKTPAAWSSHTIPVQTQPATPNHTTSRTQNTFAQQSTKMLHLQAAPGGRMAATAPRQAACLARSSCVRVVSFRDNDKELRKGKSGPRGRDTAAQKGKGKTDAFGRSLSGFTGNASQSYDSMDPAGKRLTRASQQLNKAGRRVQKGIPSADLESPVEGKPWLYSANAFILALAAGVTASSPALAAALLIKPNLLSAMDAPGLLYPLYQLLSLGLSAAAITNFVQSDGAACDELDSTLHKRLNASLSTFCVAQLALLTLALSPLSPSILRGVNGFEVLNPAGIGALGLGVAIQLYVAAVNYAKNSPEGYNAVEDVKSWLNDASNTFSGINGNLSAGYAALTASILAAGLGYIVAPLPTLAGVFGSSAMSAGPPAIVLWQLIGAGVSMVVGPVAYSLKEGAADSELSDTRYKLLNIGLLTAGLGHWLVLSPRLGDATTSGPLMPVVLGTWALAALLGGVNLLQRPARD